MIVPERVFGTVELIQPPHTTSPWRLILRSPGFSHAVDKQRKSMTITAPDDNFEPSQKPPVRQID
jgi:hypothetical protein